MATPHVLDDRFVYTTTAPGGSVVYHNKYTRIEGNSPVDSEILTFMENVGYGVSYFNLRCDAIAAMSREEITARIANALPIDTPYDTIVSVLTPAKEGATTAASSPPPSRRA